MQGCAGFLLSLSPALTKKVVPTWYKLLLFFCDSYRSWFRIAGKSVINMQQASPTTDNPKILTIEKSLFFIHISPRDFNVISNDNNLVCRLNIKLQMQNFIYP